MYDRDAFSRWMRTELQACMRHCYDGGLYAGEDGARRFAREVGACLPDFSKDEKDLQDMVSSTYSGICVIAYQLKPPVDSKVWFAEMRKGIQAALEIVPVPMPKNYTPRPYTGDSSPEGYKARWCGDTKKEEKKR